MTQKTYLVAKARCPETRQTIKSQNLSGRYEVTQRADCQREANYLAQRMQQKTGKIWIGFVEEFTLVNNRTKL